MHISFLCDIHLVFCLVLSYIFSGWIQIILIWRNLIGSEDIPHFCFCTSKTCRIFSIFSYDSDYAIFPSLIVPSLFNIAIDWTLFLVKIAWRNTKVLLVNSVWILFSVHQPFHSNNQKMEKTWLMNSYLLLLLNYNLLLEFWYVLL